MKRLVAARDERGAAHDDPVLRAVMMHLQREPRARFHHDALDLEALARVDGIVVAPRTMHLAMIGRFGASLLLDASDDRLDVLHAGFIGDENGVGGFHDHQILRADARNQPPFRMRISGRCALEHHASARDVFFAVLGG